MMKTNKSLFFLVMISMGAESFGQNAAKPGNRFFYTEVHVKDGCPGYLVSNVISVDLSHVQPDQSAGYNLRDQVGEYFKSSLPPENKCSTIQTFNVIGFSKSEGLAGFSTLADAQEARKARLAELQKFSTDGKYKVKEFVFNNNWKPDAAKGTWRKPIKDNTPRIVGYTVPNNTTVAQPIPKPKAVVVPTHTTTTPIDNNGNSGPGMTATKAD